MYRHRCDAEYHLLQKYVACSNITGLLSDLIYDASLKGELMRCSSVVAAPPDLDPPVVVRAGLAVLSGVVAKPHCMSAYMRRELFCLKSLGPSATQTS